MMIIKTLKIWDSRIHIPFNFLVINISIYVTTTKIKAPGDNIVHKLRIYPKSERLELDSNRAGNMA